ncbi:uncharacterized protein [Narcine bancroftii]|uniref:uncharacterized protein isoform X1 n=2 Tax=Narcine bancroftii TaxID=1343680 RepID=UPI0038313893
MRSIFVFPGKQRFYNRKRNRKGYLAEPTRGHWCSLFSTLGATMNDVLHLSALGRPFQLGILYDCRSDSLIPGITLWDLQTLQSNLNSQDQPSTEMHVIASDSMEEKANALSVSGSLKASFLGGLVEVKGSAKYLSDTKGSIQQARVTLQYKATTRFDQLTMSHLGRQNITYPSVFDEGSATHVVTAVLYGAHAFFVFDQMTSSTENLRDIQGNMEAMVKCLPMIAIQGEASLKMTDVQKSKAEKFSCTFYGDFSLKSNPTTFQEAINIYTSLPSLLGSDGEHSVPITVWLYPLNKLDSKAVQLVREISVGLVNRCQDVLEQLSEAVMRSNNLMKDNVAIQFPEIRDRILQFQEMCLEYKLVFQKTLARVLPSIRGGGCEEGSLVDILKNKEQSPFRQQSLTTWLDDKEREMRIVGYYLQTLKDIPIMHSTSELDKELLDPGLDYVVYFTFTTLQQEDFYLSEAVTYLQSHTAQTMQAPKPAEGTHATGPSEQWFHSPSVTQKMREQARLFLDFATANREGGKLKFLVASVQGESNTGASIYLWEGSCVRSRCFEPPSQPERPKAVGITHDSVTLQLQPPRYGAGEIVGYKVEYRSRQQEEWTSLCTPELSQTFTVSGLQPHQEYQFQYRAVTKVGVSKASGSNSVVTRPTSPPGKPIFQDCASIVILSWVIPSQIGADVKIIQYKIKWREETTASSHTEGGLCEVVWTTGSQCQYNLKGLKPDVMYRVRVSAHCGKAGSSEASEEVLIKLDYDPKRLAVKLLINSQLDFKANPSIFQLKLQRSMMLDQSKQLVKCSFGNPSKTKRMKSIMVLGATGSGKTTLINGMVNYILGVEWGDNFRYKLIQEATGKSQAESQTSSVTAYELHHQVGFNIEYSLTIIDTPGFGDTRGISRDQFITKQIQEFFTSPKGIDQIDAVCFVAQASLPRLTPTQKYVFDAILSIFGKDIAQNILILVTFADGQSPPVLEALKVANVPCPMDKNGSPLHFKFNNSAIYAQRPGSGNSADQDNSDDSEGEDDDNFDAMFWKMGTSSMKKFFSALNKMESRSLCLTKEVLRERQQLEAAVEGLQMKIRVGLSKLEGLRKTQEALKQHQTELDANKDFEYEIEITVPVKVDISRSGHYITNCQKCHFTCHDVCCIANDADKHQCVAMDCKGYCTVCPQKCIWNVHFNQKYKFSYETKKEKRTYDELKRKYEKACGEKMTQQKFLETLREEFDEVQEAVLQFIDQLSQSIQRLEEIALRPNPLSTPAYIDILIQSEKDEAKPGFIERIETLRRVKDQAELIENVSKNPNWVPEKLNQDHTRGKKGAGKKNKGFFSNFMNWIKQ